MINLNLLPWREEKREKQKKIFFGLVAAACFASIIFLAIIHITISSKILAQQYRNVYLQSEITLSFNEINNLKKIQSRKDHLLQQLNFLIYLNNNRFRIVRTLDELVRILPNAVYISSIKYDTNKIILNGIAQNNVQVAQFMQNIIAKAKWLTNPELNEISQEKNNTLGYGKTFQLTFELK